VRDTDWRLVGIWGSLLVILFCFWVIVITGAVALVEALA
jgi:hypothetical protein